MFNPKKAFTLIELLVVIAIIGILATVSVISLSNARAKSRDAKRVGDMKQIQTALELFFNDKGRYPNFDEWNTGSIFSTSTGATSTYMQVIPTAPTPNDGLCTVNQNSISYVPTSDGSSYSISLCLGGNTGALTSGPKCLTPAGIIDANCSCGDPITITSVANHICTEGAPDYDQCTYDTVKIGGQCWMKQNMNVGNIVNGNVTQESNDGQLEKYCYADDPSSNCPVYGGLYQWGETVQYLNGASNTADWSPAPTGNVQGICPAGWHIPTHNEYTALERAICTSGSCLADFLLDIITTGWRGTDEGGKLKEIGTSHWISPNTGAIDSYNFTALPAGDRLTNGSFFSQGAGAGFWSSSISGTDAWDRILDNSLATVHRGHYDRAYGFSVRCLKD